MGKFIPVEPEKWAEMVKALALVAEMDKTINASQAECRRLKAEVERLTFDPLTYLDDQGEWMPRHIHLAAVERLKAEVKRLSAADSYLQNANEYAYEKRCDELEAEVERLRKAGDGLHAFLINYIVDSRISSAYLNKLDDGWTAAKEGKKS